ncbi:hypothetical protein EK904_003450, partial [Melospiza melodia maxima]
GAWRDVPCSTLSKRGPGPAAALPARPRVGAREALEPRAGQGCLPRPPPPCSALAPATNGAGHYFQFNTANFEIPQFRWFYFTKKDGFALLNVWCFSPLCFSDVICQSLAPASGHTPDLTAKGSSYERQSGCSREAVREARDKAAKRGFCLLPRWRHLSASQEGIKSNPESAEKQAWRAPGEPGWRDGTGRDGSAPGGDRGLCPPAPRTRGAPRCRRGSVTGRAAPGRGAGSDRRSRVTSRARNAERTLINPKQKNKIRCFESLDPVEFKGQKATLTQFSSTKDTSLTEVNSFSPSVPISPSSMINQYKFEDGPELRDLFITVDDPESHITAIETFITYRVVTKTTRGEFDSSEYEVRRRYQDFLWLKSKLEEAHPTLIIPPLPEKFIMRGMVERFSDEFIETRRKALHKFLNRIADHPTLTFNEDFKIFLTAQAWELSSHKKQGPGLLSRMGQTVRAVASSVRGAVKNRPEMFTEMNNYMETFSQKINLLDKIAHRIYKEERDYCSEMKEYGPIHTLWSASEEAIGDSLKGLAGCIERCCRATERRMAGLSEHLLPMLHEYVLYSDILMGVLKRRDQIQGELDSKVDALANKKTEKDLFSEEIGKLEDKVERANNALKADWDRWKQNMQWDMRSTFTNVAENNLRYYEECLAAWESFLASQTVDLHVDEDSEDRP